MVEKLRTVSGCPLVAMGGIAAEWQFFLFFFFQRGNFVTCRSWDIKLRGAISVFLKTCFIT